MLDDGPTKARCSSHGGSTERLRVDIGPSCIESRSPGLGTCQSMLTWFDPPTCRSWLCRVHRISRVRNLTQAPAGHRRLVVVMVDADISLPILVAAIHLSAS